MPDKLLYLFAILIASLINNLLIPFVIYYQKYGFFKKRKKDFIGCNSWGIIMDGIFAGLINIAALNLLLEIRPQIVMEDLKIAFILGFAIMILAHIYMVLAKWKIWIMPLPWQFNLAGYWHLISMTLQMSFLLYPFVLIYRSPTLLKNDIIQNSILWIIFFSLLFLLSLNLSKKGLKIGRFHISNKPW